MAWCAPSTPRHTARLRLLNHLRCASPSVPLGCGNPLCSHEEGGTMPGACISHLRCAHAKKAAPASHRWAPLISPPLYPLSNLPSAPLLSPPALAGSNSGWRPSSTLNPAEPIESAFLSFESVLHVRPVHCARAIRPHAHTLGHHGALPALTSPCLHSACLSRPSVVIAPPAPPYPLGTGSRRTA